jgi:hypothetical protein
MKRYESVLVHSVGVGFVLRELIHDLPQHGDKEYGSNGRDVCLNEGICKPLFFF